MKLSPAAELAIRGALVLVEQYGRAPTSLADICELRGMSREYLAKVFARLVRADLITPVRGKKGGYVLARDPREITLLDVIAAVEGPQALNLCQFDPPRCENASSCKMQKVWSELQEFFNEKLAAMTLADCI